MQVQNFAVCSTSYRLGTELVDGHDSHIGWWVSKVSGCISYFEVGVKGLYSLLGKRL